MNSGRARYKLRTYPVQNGTKLGHDQEHEGEVAVSSSFVAVAVAVAVPSSFNSSASFV